MQRNYSEMMNLAVDLAGYGGYLTNQEQQAEAKLRGQFNGARNRFVYALLKEGDTAEGALASVAAEIEELKALQPEWSDTLDFVHEEIVARTHKEAGKSPLLRAVTRWTPIALGVVALAVYFGIRFTSGVEITQPIETRQGIEQRAQATAKVLRYDDWMSTSTRRGGFWKGLLLWPIEPTEAEIQSAGEFVGLVAEGHQALAEAGGVCGGPVPGNKEEISEERLALIGAVADYVLSEGVQWEQPPAMTILTPIGAAYPCSR